MKLKRYYYSILLIFIFFFSHIPLVISSGKGNCHWYDTGINIYHYCSIPGEKCNGGQYCGIKGGVCKEVSGGRWRDCYCLPYNKTEERYFFGLFLDWKVVKARGRSSTIDFQFQADPNNSLEIFDFQNIDSSGNIIDSQKFSENSVTGYFKINFSDEIDDGVVVFLSNMKMEFVSFDFLGNSTGENTIELLDQGKSIRGFYNSSTGTIKFDEDIPFTITNNLLPKKKKISVRLVLEVDESEEKYKAIISFSSSLEKEIPCFVRLDSFSATPIEGNIYLDWLTTTEIDSMFFRIWRAIALDKKKRCTSVNLSDYSMPELVKEPADVNIPIIAWTLGDIEAGQCYSRVDKYVDLGVTYCYALEEIDSNNKSHFYLGSDIATATLDIQGTEEDRTCVQKLE